MAGESIDLRVSVLESELKEMRKTQNDMNDRLIRIEENFKANKDKIEVFGEYAKVIVDMSTNVKLLTERVEDVLNKFNRQEKKIELQNKRIEELEKLPGRVAIKGWAAIVVPFLTAIGGLIAGAIIKGGV